VLLVAVAVLLLPTNVDELVRNCLACSIVAIELLLPMLAELLPIASRLRKLWCCC
jgi:hypothetical protein